MFPVVFQNILFINFNLAKLIMINVCEIVDQPKCAKKKIRAGLLQMLLPSQTSDLQQV